MLVPIRSFDGAKTRLAEVLDVGERRSLARAMATTVVRAALGLPVVVVSDDTEVIEWSATVGARALPVGVAGLNPSVSAAVESLAAEGVERVIVAHADLPHARDLRGVGGAPVAIVADRHGDGSNVLAVPTGAGFRFSYGSGSFDAHLAEARRLALAFVVIDDPDLAWDVDGPDDLPFDWRDLLPLDGRADPER